MKEFFLQTDGSFFPSRRFFGAKGIFLCYNDLVKNNSALFVSIAGFVLAIFICSFFKLDFYFSACLISISIILFVFQKFYVSEHTEKRKIFLLLLFLLFFAFGALRYGIADSNLPDVLLENSVGKEATFVAIISDEPQKKESGTALDVDLKIFISAGSSIPVSGKALVNTGLYPEFKYGDKVSIYGKLEKPKNFSSSPNIDSSSSPATKDFDYVSYLAKDNIFYTIDFAKVSLISSGHGNFIKTILYKIKNGFIENISRVIPEPEASLFEGIELGAKSSIDKATSNAFRISGLSHIVALSGYNITIVAGAIMRALSFLPKMAGLSTGIIGIILFVIMSGSSSTAIRAGIMALIVILSQMTRRNYRVGRALIVAALAMILVNPKILVFDISFELSFVATVAIIYVAPILKNKFSWITEKYGLRDIVSSTISAQILVLPLILCKMGMLSFFALPANILVLAFVPAVMFFGFVTGMLGFIWALLSIPFAWITFIFLFYMIHVAEFFANLPFSSVFIPWFSPTFTFIAYALIAIWIFHERKINLNNENKKHGF